MGFAAATFLDEQFRKLNAGGLPGNRLHIPHTADGVYIIERPIRAIQKAGAVITMDHGVFLCRTYTSGDNEDFLINIAADHVTIDGFGYDSTAVNLNATPVPANHPFDLGVTENVIGATVRNIRFARSVNGIYNKGRYSTFENITGAPLGVGFESDCNPKDLTMRNIKFCDDSANGIGAGESFRSTDGVGFIMRHNNWFDAFGCRSTGYGVGCRFQAAVAATIYTGGSSGAWNGGGFDDAEQACDVAQLRPDAADADDGGGRKGVRFIGVLFSGTRGATPRNMRINSSSTTQSDDRESVVYLSNCYFEESGGDTNGGDDDGAGGGHAAIISRGITHMVNCFYHLPQSSTRNYFARAETGIFSMIGGEVQGHVNTKGLQINGGQRKIVVQNVNGLGGGIGSTAFTDRIFLQGGFTPSATNAQIDTGMLTPEWA